MVMRVARVVVVEVAAAGRATLVLSVLVGLCWLCCSSAGGPANGHSGTARIAHACHSWCQRQRRYEAG
jgi:hypothetical protein